MTLRVHNIDKWRRFVGGKVLSLPGIDGLQRTVTVQLNTVALTKVYLVEPDDAVAKEPVVFLGAVTGRGAIEFSTSGQTFLTVVSDEDVWFHTDDVGEKAIDLADAYSFAKLLERKERNPTLELMMFLARRNEQKRDAQQAEQMAAMRAEFAAQIAASKANPQTGEVDDELAGGSSPESDDDSGATGVSGAATVQQASVAAPAVAKKGAARGTA